MAGTNYYTQISPSTWVAFTEDIEVVNGIQLAMVAKCTGTPKTAADGPLYVNLFEHGCIMTQIDTGSGNPAIYQNTGTRALPVWTLMDTGTGDQTAIQWKDEGVNLGTSGTVTSVDFVGGEVTATRIADAITVTIPLAQTPTQYQDEGVNLGTSGTVDTLNFVGAGVTATRVGNVVTATIPAGGGSGLTAYGYAVGQSDTVIGANADVVFDIGATVYPNTGFTSVPAPAGTSFVVASTGAYEFDFYVSGLPASNVPLEFTLYVNGAAPALPTGFEFRSDTTATATDKLTVRGNGIISLTAGDVVTLHNRTNTVTDTVTVTSVPLGGEAGANRTLSLKKIN